MKGLQLWIWIEERLKTVTSYTIWSSPPFEHCKFSLTAKYFGGAKGGLSRRAVFKLIKVTYKSKPMQSMKNKCTYNEQLEWILVSMWFQQDGDTCHHRAKIKLFQQQFQIKNTLSQEILMSAGHGNHAIFLVYCL